MQATDFPVYQRVTSVSKKNSGLLEYPSSEFVFRLPGMNLIRMCFLPFSVIFFELNYLKCILLRLLVSSVKNSTAYINYQNSNQEANHAAGK